MDTLFGQSQASASQQAPPAQAERERRTHVRADIREKYAERSALNKRRVGALRNVVAKTDEAVKKLAERIRTDQARMKQAQADNLQAQRELRQLVELLRRNGESI
jgi:hypothetical protein